mmetsp:Transcript_9044/g.20015  ORF Transcript_9044/g.20015 Transcript_9044/m.20015 type:complete len:568 (+) Transcript_9044:1118-2821(+)
MHPRRRAHAAEARRVLRAAARWEDEGELAVAVRDLAERRGVVEVLDHVLRDELAPREVHAHRELAVLDREGAPRPVAVDHLHHPHGAHHIHVHRNPPLARPRVVLLPRARHQIGRHRLRRREQACHVRPDRRPQVPPARARAPLHMVEVPPRQRVDGLGAVHGAPAVRQPRHDLEAPHQVGVRLAPHNVQRRAPSHVGDPNGRLPVGAHEVRGRGVGRERLDSPGADVVHDRLDAQHRGGVAREVVKGHLRLGAPAPLRDHVYQRRPLEVLRHRQHLMLQLLPPIPPLPRRPYRAVGLVADLRARRDVSREARDPRRVDAREAHPVKELFGELLPDGRHESDLRGPQLRSERGLRAAPSQPCTHDLGVGLLAKHELVDDDLAHDQGAERTELSGPIVALFVRQHPAPDVFGAPVTHLRARGPLRDEACELSHGHVHDCRGRGIGDSKLGTVLDRGCREESVVDSHGVSPRVLGAGFHAHHTGTRRAERENPPGPHEHLVLPRPLLDGEWPSKSAHPMAERRPRGAEPVGPHGPDCAAQHLQGEGGGECRAAAPPLSCTSHHRYDALW